jgi:hypothetical protein
VVVTSESLRKSWLAKELAWSVAYTALLMVLVVAIILVSGESFHENFGVFLRVSVAPIALIRWLCGPIDVAWPIVALAEFFWFFTIVVVARLTWRRLDR